MALDAEQAKAALWRRLFGADLSPALVAALCYIDVQERLVKLTNGGWVRDEGDRMLASSGDPQVVAMLVAAAQSKGWTAVKIWGDDDFVREARRQFEAAGIPVTVVDPPPDSKVEPAEPPPARDPLAIVEDFRRRRAAAESRLAEIQSPAPPPAALVKARKAEDAADEEWRKLWRVRKTAKSDRDAAKTALEKVGLFGRGAARRRLAAAQLEFDAAHEAFRDASDRHDDAKAEADLLQKDFDRAESQRRVDLAIEECKAKAEVALALECEIVAAESAEIAVEGHEAVEAAARARLAARNDLRSGLEDDASAPPVKP